MKRLILIITALLFSVTPVLAQSGFPAVEVYKGTSKGVVLIVSQINKKSSMAGAGSFINDRGYVITNAHVVVDRQGHKPYPVIRVFTKPDELTGDLERDLTARYKAEVVAFNTDLDLALLKVEDYPRDVPVIKLANPKDISIGEEVVAIGHPEQGGLWSLTYGRISGQMANQSNVKGKDVFQTDTSVNRGNSGGPLLDRRGYMVGVNTNIARLAADNMPITGVNFALKASVVKKWVGTQGMTIAYGSKPIGGEMMLAQAEPVKTTPKEKAVTEEKREQKAEPAPPKKDTHVMEAKVREPEPEEKKPEPKAEIWVSDDKGKKRKYTVDSDEGTSKMELKVLESKKKIEQEEKEKETKKDTKKSKSDTILTPKKPFTFDDLFSQVEKELEDMMDDMKSTIDMKKKKSSRRRR